MNKELIKKLKLVYNEKHYHYNRLYLYCEVYINWFEDSNFIEYYVYSDTGDYYSYDFSSRLFVGI